MTGLRILVAHDGSAGAERAVELIRATRWPAGTSVRLLAVAQELTPIVATLPDTEEDASIRAALECMLDRVAAGLAPLATERSVARGRPASLIASHAGAWRADLVVMGSRGHGPLATAILGSVAAETVDHAPCPVLIVRGLATGPVLLADDGSAGAAAARALLVRASGLAADGARVVSIVHLPPPAQSGIALTVRDLARAERANELAEARREHRRLAVLAADVLRDAGISATATVREGDPAHEILGEAQALGASLIALGSRGRTGLMRVLLGSVARSVLTNAPTSVLIARERGA